jgi:hypothetical protein
VLSGAKRLPFGTSTDTYRGLVLTPDGTQLGAYIKDLPSKELANELLASWLARELGLPAPRTYLGLASSSVCPATKGPICGVDDRLVLVSVDENVPNLNQHFGIHVDSDINAILIKDFLEWPELGKLYAFDSWVANVDRNTGNVLFGGRGKYIIIDHGQCFTGPKWNVKDLKPFGNYLNKLKNWATTNLSDAQRSARMDEAGAFAKVIGTFEIKSCLEDSLVNKAIDNMLCDAVGSFLTKRKKKIVAAANDALNGSIKIAKI